MRTASAPPRAAVVAGQVAIAVVWLYEGLVAKIIGARADELAIIASVPWLPDQAAGIVTLGIGVIEVGVAVWVLTGWTPRAAATVQTLLLAGFNAGGLIVGGAQIPDPVHLVVTNLALLALVWLVALSLARPPGPRSLPT